MGWKVSVPAWAFSGKLKFGGDSAVHGIHFVHTYSKAEICEEGDGVRAQAPVEGARFVGHCDMLSVSRVVCSWLLHFHGP